MVFADDAMVNNIKTKLTGKNWQILQVKGFADESGEIVFHNSSGSESSHYLRKEILYGALFSEDKEFYECNFEKVLNVLRLKIQLQIDRIKLLEQEYTSNHCLFYYGAAPGFARDSLEKMNESLRIDDVGNIHSYYKQYESSNTDLTKEFNCAYLY